MSEIDFRALLIRLSKNYLREHDTNYDVFLELESFYQKNHRHDYSLISEFVFDHTEENEIIAYNLEEIIDIASGKGSDFINSYFKLKDHLNLSLAQKKYIENSVTKLQSEIIVAKGEIVGAKTDIKEAKDEAERFTEEIEHKLHEFETRTKKITTEFVSILGIFSAVIFAAFGGLEILKNILGNIEKVHTGKLLVFSSLTTGSIVFLVFLLLNGISKLTKLDLRSCNCETEKCDCHIVKKHPSIAVISIILIFIFLIGITEYVIDYRAIFEDISKTWGSWLQLFVVLVFSFLFFIFGTIWYNTNKKH